MWLGSNLLSNRPFRHLFASDVRRFLVWSLLVLRNFLNVFFHKVSALTVAYYFSIWMIARIMFAYWSVLHSNQICWNCSRMHRWSLIMWRNSIMVWLRHLKFFIVVGMIYRCQRVLRPSIFWSLAWLGVFLNNLIRQASGIWIRLRITPLCF